MSVQLFMYWPMSDTWNLHIWWNFILPNIQNFHQIAWKYTLNPHASKIHFKTTKSTQTCPCHTPETNNWWDTCLGVGPFFQEYTISSVCGEFGENKKLVDATILLIQRLGPQLAGRRSLAKMALLQPHYSYICMINPNCVCVGSKVMIE